MKSSLNSAAIKQFFVNHGEKVGLVVALLLTAYAVICALEIEPYSKTAKELQTNVDLARQNLNTSDKRLNLVEAKIKLPPIEFVKLIEQELIQKLNAARFNGIEWNQPLFETKQRRLEPTYLAVRDLRVEFHYAAVNHKGSADGAPKPVGEEFIAVTGLIPLEDQTAAYYRAFQSALDQVTNAIPVYQNFEIKRAEMTDPKQTIDWNKIEPLKNEVAVAAEVAKWSGPGPEIPAAGLTVPVLTEPLPPLSNAEKTKNQEYASWSTHPLLEAASTPAVADGGGAASGGVLGVPVAPPPQLAQVTNQQKDDKAEKPKNLLFRFIDFDVHPGKQYRYQVRLILKNPNFQLDPAHLEKPELSEGDVRLAPWSTPSQAVGIPYLDWHFAGGLKGNGVGGDNEPEITMGFKRWEPQYGAVVRAKFSEILRGALLASASTEIEFPTPGAEGVSKVATAFKTGGMLLDFGWERTEFRLGGPPNDRKVNRPSEALVLNSRGELIICAQTMDQLQWDDLTSVGVGGAGPRGGGGVGAAPTAGVIAAPVAPVSPLGTQPAATPVPVTTAQPTATAQPATTAAPAAATPTATPSSTAPKLQLKLD